MHGKQHAGFVNTLRSENDLAKNASSRGAPSGSFAFATMAAGLNWGSQRKGSFPSPVPKTGRTAIGPIPVIRFKKVSMGSFWAASGLSGFEHDLS